MRIFSFLFIIFMLTGCIDSQPEDLSALHTRTSDVVMTLTPASTTQNEVLSQFGAPNIITKGPNGRPVWTYEKQMSVSYSKNHAITIAVPYVNTATSRTDVRPTRALALYFDKTKTLTHAAITPKR